MIWSRLKSMKCPECNHVLQHNVMYKQYECTVCEFQISDIKFASLVSKLYNIKEVSVDSDNFHDLNNLGHKKITEDFSDSPFI